MRPVVATWSSRFHDTGMESGPGALVAAIEPESCDRVLFDPTDPSALIAGLPALARAVAESGDDVPAALLGECTLAPAAIAGTVARAGPVALVWIDAHGDANTPQTTSSGFLGGMPVAIAAGWCRIDLRRAAGLEPPIEEAAIALVGVRDLDPAERAAIEASALVCADSSSTALAALPPDLPLHVHLDADVLDPAVHAGADFPAPGGWDSERLLAEAAVLAASGRVAGVSVCLGNPHRDVDATVARTCAAAVALLTA